MANDFHQLLTATLPQMRGFAVMKTRDPSAADDLLQQTALKALKAEHQFTMGTNFRSWLYRIMKNEFITSARRKPAANIDDLPEELFGQSGGQDEGILMREILMALDRIPPIQRAVMIMVCADGMTYAEAGAKLGCSVGTIKSRLWRARRALQDLVVEGKEPAPHTSAFTQVGLGL